MRAALLALLICAASALLEGALAGRDVRARFAELRQPRYSPPLTLWILIGGTYYLICFVVIYRLIAAGAGIHRLPLALLLALMVANAAWGLLFFRRKDLRGSFLAFVPYTLLALALIVVLCRSDPTSALVLAPYVMYLGYAVWWSWRVWALNRGMDTSSQSQA